MSKKKKIKKPTSKKVKTAVAPASTKRQRKPEVIVTTDTATETLCGGMNYWTVCWTIATESIKNSYRCVCEFFKNAYHTIYEFVSNQIQKLKTIWSKYFG